MKQFLTLLLACSLCTAVAAQTGTGSSAQPADCQSKFDAINRSYDEQLAGFAANPKINAIDREYRTLMLNFYRAQKLSAAEAECSKGAQSRYHSCLDGANALNQTYNSQLTAARSNGRYSKQERAQKIDEINQERNTKLRELLSGCSSR